MRMGHERAPLLTVACLAIAAAAFVAQTAPARGQVMEEKFQDLFVTAGYCTAFGAAIGTAALAWEKEPAENLKYVAMGASLGFIGGSILGTYIIFSPGLTDAPPQDAGGEGLAEASQRTHRAQAEASRASPGPTLAQGRGRALVVRPWLARDSWRPVGIEGSVLLAEF